MRVSVGDFLHELAKGQPATLVLDRDAGTMTLQVPGVMEKHAETFTTPMVGRMTAEHYDVMYRDVINIVQRINLLHSNLTVMYV
jgi:hypothetical protein